MATGNDRSAGLCFGATASHPQPLAEGINGARKLFLPDDIRVKRLGKLLEAAGETMIREEYGDPDWGVGRVTREAPTEKARSSYRGALQLVERLATDEEPAGRDPRVLFDAYGLLAGHPMAGFGDLEHLRIRLLGIFRERLASEDKE